MSATSTRTALGGTDGSTDGDTDESTDGSGEEGSYGSDPELDALYDDCEDGDYAACDELFNDSPSDSEYEDFGDTCGGRNEPAGFCVDIYEDGGDDDGGLTDGLTDSADLPEDFEESLADTYEEMFNLSRDQAECLAGKLADAVEQRRARPSGGHLGVLRLPLRLRHQHGGDRRQLAIGARAAASVAALVAPGLSDPSTPGRASR